MHDRDKYIEKVYKKYVNGIYRYFYIRTNCVETSQDLTSITFHKLVENIEHFDDNRGNISQYLYSIARNSLIDFYRKKKEKNITEFEENMADNSNISCELSVVNSRNEKVLQICLKELDVDEQLLVHMRYTCELSYKEISKELNIPVKTVGVNLHRVIKKIEKIFLNKDLKKKLDI